MREIYLIIFTGFGMFGLYCFIDTVFSFFALAKFPPTVTIIKNVQEEMTFRKIKHIENNVPNNYTIFYPFDSAKDEKEQQEILHKYLQNVLDVNNR